MPYVPIDLRDALRRHLMLFLLILGCIPAEGQSKRYVETAIEAGYLYQPSKLLSGPNPFVEAPKGMSLKITPFFASSISLISDTNVHKFRFTFAEWQNSFSFNKTDDGSGNISRSESYWMITYNWGKLKQLSKRDKVIVQLTAGPILAVKQEATLNDSPAFTEFQRNQDLIRLDLDPLIVPRVSLGLQSEAVLKFRIYKAIRLQLGVNGSLWLRPTYADRDVNIFVNGQFLEKSTMRSYKHVFAFFLAVSNDF